MRAKVSQDVAPDNAITGTVQLQPGVASARSVSGNAKLVLTLEDISQQPSVPIANKTIQPLGQFPVNFRLEFNPNRVVPDDILIIVADVTDGDRRYTMPLQQQVLTKGKPSQVSINLIPEPTASEKMLSAFRELQGQLGGMKISKGTSLGEHSSRAWQIFKKNNHVQFVVDIEDNFETNGRTRSDYAYKDGKPWVVIRKDMKKAGAKPSSIKRVGWGSDGELVLNELEASGKTTKMSQRDVRSLHSDAESMFNQAGGK